MSDYCKREKRKKPLVLSILSETSCLYNMNWKTLCNLDDLAKFILLDHCSAYLKTMKQINVPLKSFITEESRNIKERFFKSDNIETALSELLALMERFRLYFYFALKNQEDLVSDYLKAYLQFLHSSSMVEMQETNRYSLDKNKGVKIIAKTHIEAHTNISNLFGMYLPVTPDVEEYLCKNNLDFSMICTESSSQRSNLLLGSIAFVNHDCNPNAYYKYIRKDVVIVRTSKDIKAGEEILVFYSNVYFGEQNDDCECNTCRDSKKRDDATFSVDKDLNNFPVDTTVNDDEDFKCLTASKNLYVHGTPAKSPRRSISFENLDESSNTHKHVKNVDCAQKGENEVADDDVNHAETAKNDNASNSTEDIQRSPVKNPRRSRLLYKSYDSIKSISFESIDESSNSHKHIENVDCSREGENDVADDDVNIFETDENVNASNRTEDVRGRPAENLRRSRRLSELQKGANDVAYDDVDAAKAAKNSSNSTKDDNKQVEKKKIKKVYCKYCKDFKHQFARHIKKHHKNKQYVKMYLKAKKDKKLQDRILAFIRNKGYGDLEDQTKKVIPVKATRKGVKTTKEKCNLCTGRFSKETLQRHMNNCFGNDLASMKRL